MDAEEGVVGKKGTVGCLALQWLKVGEQKGEELRRAHRAPA